MQRANTSVDGWLQNVFPVQYFTVAAGKTEVVPFPIEVPYLFHKTVRWQVIAGGDSLKASAAGSFPVRTTKTLVTERFPMPLHSGAQQFQFQKLLQADAATEHQSLTLELFTTPTWHVVSALPGLHRNDTGNAVQAFLNLYAEALAISIRNRFPEMAALIDSWTRKDTSPNQPGTGKQHQRYS